MSSFYNLSELAQLGLKKYGSNVLISRYARFYNPHNLEIGSNVRIDDFCVISAGVGIKIGDYVHVSCYSGLWGNRGLTISDYCNISIGTRILTETDDYGGQSLVGSSFPLKYRKLSGGPMILHPFVNLGMNTIILPIPEIPEGVVIGASSLVAKPLQPWTIYAGIPVKPIKPRVKDIIKLKQLLMSNF